MKIDSRYFSEITKEIQREQVAPAFARSIFPVNREKSSSLLAHYRLQSASALSEEWNLAGHNNELDEFSTSTTAGSNQVYEKQFKIEMTHHERMAASEGRVIDWQDKIATAFALIEQQIDAFCFKGYGKIKGIGDDTLYSTNKNDNLGTTISAGKKINNLSDEEALNLFLDGLEASRRSNLYPGRKNILISSAINHFLIKKRIGGTAVTLLDHLRKNVRDLGEVMVVPNFSGVVIFEKNRRYLTLRLPFDLEQLGEVKDEFGTLAAAYGIRCAGLMIKDKKPLVRISGLE